MIRLPEDASSEDIYHQYQKALRRTLQSLDYLEKQAAYTRPNHDPYNVLLVKEWLIVIPRRRKAYDGIGTNSAGMMGMAWLKNQEERDGWTRLGMTKLLEVLGFPNHKEL